MKTKNIKQCHDGGIWLQLTTEIGSGKTVVEMRRDDSTSDGTLLTPTEARRLARALASFADAADRMA